MTQIFLDDEREPVNYLDFIIVRNYSEFVSIVLNIGFPDELTYVTFDHDLGDDSLDGYECAKFLVSLDQDRKGKLLGDNFKFYVHSQNPVGAMNINSYLNNYLEWKRSNG